MAYNLYLSVYRINMVAGRVIPVLGSGLMVLVALLLVTTALFIGFVGVCCT